MKNSLYILVFLFSLSIIGCNKDEIEDLTVDLTGDYIGGYGNNTNGNINPYEITVTKLSENRINIKPRSGTEFNQTEFELVRSNISNIISPTDNNQQSIKSVIFAIGNTVGITMSIDPSGTAHTFVGEKQ